MQPQLSHYAPCSHAHDSHENHDGHAKHHLSHAFVGLHMDLPNPMSEEHLQRWLRSLPSNVLRAKGVVRLTNAPDRWFQFQRVDKFRSEATLHELQQEPVFPPCAVLIGVELDRILIAQALIEAAGKASLHAE